MRRDVMMRRSRFETMTLRTVLILVVLHSSIGVSNFPPMLYDNYLQTGGNAVEYPNPEAKVWNALTPSLNSDYVFSEELITSEDEIPEEVLDNDHVLLQKRPNVKLIPRIGRKKRSLSEEDNKTGQPDSLEDAMKKNWASDTDQDYFVTADKRKPKNRIVFIPRIGKKSASDLGEVEEKRAIFIPRIGKKSISDLGDVEDKRAFFVPRIGKKSASDLGEIQEKRAIFVPRIGKKRASDLDEVEEKRAIFIPRIGKKSVSDLGENEDKRAIFVPRIGKKSASDLGEVGEKRAIFIPRIGKKSASEFDEMEEKRAIFIPRIGRGALIPQMTRYNPQYRIRNRAVFIPRIG